MNLKIGKKPVLSSVPIQLIRQWCFCPRIVYYLELTNHPVNYPTWVQQGENFHATEEQLWQRRNLSRFNLQAGTRHHNLLVRSKKINLHGIVDLAIETEDAIYAVEFKLSAHLKRRGDIMQLVAYAMLLEEHFNKPSPIGFLLGPKKTLHSIKINDTQKQAVLKIVNNIFLILSSGNKPHSNATAAQCCNCEYLNHCNDRL